MRARRDFHAARSRAESSPPLPSPRGSVLKSSKLRRSHSSSP